MTTTRAGFGLLLLALLATSLNLRAGLTAVAPIMERIGAELALSRGAASLVTTLPVLCMGLFAPLAPGLAARFGLERTIAASLALIGAASMLRLAPGSVALLASAVLLGIGIATAGPLLSGFIKQRFHGHIGLVVGLYSVGMALSGALGAVGTLPLVERLGGWHAALAVWALPALVSLTLWLAIVRPLPGRPGPAAAARLPWREPRAWLLTLFFALQAGLFYTLATWTVAMYQDSGFDAHTASALVSLFMVVGLAGAIGFPALAGRVRDRRPLLVAAALLALAGLLGMALAPRSLPWLASGLAGIGLNGLFSMGLSLPLYETDDHHHASAWTAMMLSAGYCLGAFAPVLAGALRDVLGDYRSAFLGLAGIALVQLLIVTRFKPRD